LTLAFWLCRHGHEPFIVERSPRLREEGYMIVRPSVERTQRAGRWFAKWFISDTRARLGVRDAIMRVGTSSLASLVLRRRFSLDNEFKCRSGIACGLNPKGSEHTGKWDPWLLGALAFPTHQVEEDLIEGWGQHVGGAHVCAVEDLEYHG
jgi:hypothetical protein